MDRNVRPRVEVDPVFANLLLQQQQQQQPPPLIALPPSAAAAAAAWPPPQELPQEASLVSVQQVNYNSRYSWALTTGNTSWTCVSCQAAWNMFVVAEPTGLQQQPWQQQQQAQQQQSEQQSRPIQEIAIHHGGMQRWGVPGVCSGCGVQWHMARHAANDRN